MFYQKKNKPQTNNKQVKKIFHAETEYKHFTDTTSGLRDGLKVLNN